TTRVLREGKEVSISTEDVVVGDTLILYEGAVIPADARLINAIGLTVNESSFTGESLPINKKSDAIVDRQTPTAKRINSVFAGTTILSGQGTAIVVAVGLNSEFGKIAQAVQKTQKEKTILQDLMTKLAKILAI